MEMEKKVCGELLNLEGYSPDTIWEMYKVQGTKEECQILLAWLERIYG